MHDNEVNDEKRDRAVRWVLWASLGIAVAPMLAALALVQPTLGRLRLSEASGQLQSELPSESASLGSFLSRSASGIVRAVQDTLIPSDIKIVPDLRPLDDSGPARRFTSTLGNPDPVMDCAAREDPESCRGSAAFERLHADAEVPLITLGPPPSEGGRGAALAGAALGGLSPASRGDDAFWRLQDEGVFVRTVGGASFTVAGAVAIDDFSALRISDSGLGSYLSDAPELHHSALSGGVARTFAQGDWRLRPELDVEASYLALDKVRLDAGEAGLFVPETEDWIFSARPSVAVEGELDAAAGFRVLPSLRAGATWLSQDEFSSAAMMLDAPITVAGVAATVPVEELFADVEAGLGLAASDRIQLSVRYGRVFGEAVEAQTGRFELNMQF